jgi:hypothetical protein
MAHGDKCKSRIKRDSTESYSPAPANWWRFLLKEKALR